MGIWKWNFNNARSNNAQINKVINIVPTYNPLNLLVSRDS